MDKWLSRLESSNWMLHIRDTLNCACLVAQCLDQEGASVLVRGLEGLDATSLVTSLTQVILNPDCRTVRGMEALVEWEWLQAGYRFPIRHQESCYSSGRSKTQTPTFLLFLDCVGQIHQQFPCSFEFSTSFLIMLLWTFILFIIWHISGHLWSRKMNMKLAERTVSLWSYLNQPDILQVFPQPNVWPQ